MEGFEENGWAEGVIQKLQEDIDQGAVGFKVWKDIGMTFQDSLGRFVFSWTIRYLCPYWSLWKASGCPCLPISGSP